MITFQLSPEAALFARTARDFAERRLRPHARPAERGLAVPPELASEYLALGFGAVEIPEAYGGLGLGIAGRALIEMNLAFGDAAMAAGMPCVGPGAEAVLALGSEAQRIDLLPRWIEHGARIAIGWSEEKSKPGTFSTIAREQDDGTFAITGRKIEVQLGHRAEAIVVFARAVRREGRADPAAFVVDLSDRSSVRISDPEAGLGMNAAPVVSVALEDRIVPADRWLHAPDFSQSVARLFLRTGLVAAARQVGLSRAAFEHARGYAEGRTAFGKPISHFQGLAFLLADMATRVEVMDGLVHRAAWAFDVVDANAERLAAMAIAECQDGAIWVTNQAVQVLGGAGFVTDHPVEKWMRDARAQAAFGIPSELCDLIVGRTAIDGTALSMEEDAPMPGLQTVVV